MVLNAKNTSATRILRRACEDLLVWRWRFPTEEREQVDHLRSFLLMIAFLAPWVIITGRGDFFPSFSKKKHNKKFIIKLAIASSCYFILLLNLILAAMAEASS
jgi:hypothetical protein